jgi:DNA-binding beta-propeller fold protein YncE
LWITNARGRLIRLDATTGSGRARDARVPVSKAISVHGHTVWVANPRDQQVMAFDSRSRRLLTTIVEPNEPAALAADADGGVWVAVRDQSGLTPDVATHYDAGGRMLAQVPFASGIAALVIRPRSLWVAEMREPRVVRVDLRTGRPHGHADIIRPARSLAWGAGHVWATSPDDNALSRIDPRNFDVAPATVGHFPMQIAVTGGRVFVACVLDRVLAVVDPRSMRLLQRLPMPLSPFGVAADARHVWVTSLSERAVTRVDLQ